MSIQSNINQAVGAVSGAFLASKHMKSQQKIIANTSKVESNLSEFDQAADNLINAQARTKAMKSTLNARFPFANLKNWKPKTKEEAEQLRLLRNNVVAAEEQQRTAEDIVTEKGKKVVVGGRPEDETNE